jgi:hypothetical protein
MGKWFANPKMKGCQMNEKPTLNMIRMTLASAACLMASTAAIYGQGAAATISDVPASGGYDYTILLQDTGTTALNSFWYGWTTSGNNLPSTPSSMANNVGWGQSVFSGHSIEWANSTGTTLNPGGTATFTFFSPDSPLAITTSPAGESVAYVNGIQFNQNVSGVSSPVFSPTLVATPEPSSAALLGLGALGLLGIGWQRIRAEK